MQRTDHAGDRFGRLTVVRYSRTANRRAYWLCKCACGKTHEAQAAALRAGSISSCGCLRRETAATTSRATARKRANSRRRHGNAAAVKQSRTYNSWQAMRARCANPRNAQFKYYGARGVSVCVRWQNSFENFLRDMGSRPPGKTIDRKSPYGNYAPGNCRWATPLEQRANRREAK